MARPRNQEQPDEQPQPQEQPQPPQLPASPLGPVGDAALAGSLAGPKAVLPVAATAPLAASAVAKAAANIIAAFDSASKSRLAEEVAAISTSIRRIHPERTPEEIDKLLREEARREVAFRNKQRERLRKLLPEALKIGDPEQRALAVKKILDTEKRYTQMRIEQMGTRSLNAVERASVKDNSPLGAYWKLSSGVKEHTLGCLLAGEKFWPWAVLDHFHPQLHPGCACSLLTHDEAVERGYMRSGDIPDTNDAIRRAKEIMATAEKLYEALDQDEIEGYLLELQEGRWSERWPEGTPLGGKFRPRRGGSPHAALISRKAFRELKRVLPRAPESPRARERNRRGRWTWIKGVQTFVPEHRAFERMIDGTQFYSPPQSTNVYRDGSLVDTPEGGPQHPDVSQGHEIVKLKPKDSDAFRRAHDAALRHRHDADTDERIDRALIEQHPDVLPVGEGASANRTHEALKRHGFKAGRTVVADDGNMVSYTHPASNSGLTVVYDKRGTVHKQAWTPGQHVAGLPDHPDTRPGLFSDVEQRRDPRMVGELHAVAAPGLTTTPVTLEQFRDVFNGFEYEVRNKDGSREKVRSRVTDSGDFGKGQFGLEGVFEREDGTKVGWFVRDLNKNEVSHEALFLDYEPWQGQGFAGAFNAHAEEGYRRLGFDAITVNTDNVGGYAWARAGFEFDPRMWGDDETAGHLAARNILTQYGNRHGLTSHEAVRLSEAADHVPSEVIEEFLRRFPTRHNILTGEGLDGKFSREFEIAGFGREHSWTENGQKMWLGKMVMLDAKWSGVKHLR